jgi:hypothetical protein
VFLDPIQRANDSVIVRNDFLVMFEGKKKLLKRDRIKLYPLTNRKGVVDTSRSSTFSFKFSKISVFVVGDNLSTKEATILTASSSAAAMNEILSVHSTLHLDIKRHPPFWFSLFASPTRRGNG